MATDWNALADTALWGKDAPPQRFEDYARACRAMARMEDTEALAEALEDGDRAYREQAHRVEAIWRDYMVAAIRAYLLAANPEADRG